MGWTGSVRSRGVRLSAVRGCLRIVYLLAAPILLGGCCTDVDLSLGRFSGFMSASFDLSAKIDIELFTSITLNASIGGRAGIPSLGDAYLGIDLADFDFVSGEVREDIDQDGYIETVHVLAAIDKNDAEDQRIFIYWKGDKYTLDSGRCYLAWVRGKTFRLASAPCDDAEQATVCRMQVDDESSFACEACNRSGQCIECNADGKVEDCRYRTVDAGREIDAGGEIDAGTEIDAGMEADVSTGVDAGIDASVIVDLSSCERQVVELAREAGDCAMDVFLDERSLCQNNSGEVTICYTAYEAANLFGQNTCAVLADQIVCGPIMNQDDPATNCERRLDELVSAGAGCGLNIQVQPSALCPDSSGQVDACFVAYDVARLAGQNICAVLGDNLVCPVLN